MSDITEKLRKYAGIAEALAKPHWSRAFLDAIDEIERLGADRDRWAQQADDRRKACEIFIAEIDRLRELLRESISPPPNPEPVLTTEALNGFVRWAKDYEQRVREALGDDSR